MDKSCDMELAQKGANEDNEDEASPRTMSWQMAGVMMANIIIGLGLLNYPFAFKEAGGVMPALIIQTISLVPIVAGFLVIGKDTVLFPDATYQDMVRRHCGFVVGLFFNIVVFINVYGACIVLLVTLADQIDAFLRFTLGIWMCEHWLLSRQFLLPCFAFLCILPWCFINHLDGRAIKCITILGTVMTGYITFLVIYKYFVPDEEFETSQSSSNFQIIEAMKAMPTIFYSFDAHIHAMPIFSCLRRRTTSEVCKALTLGLSISVAIYSIVGIFGYLGNKDHVASDLLLSYSYDNVVIIAVLGMAIKTISTYPVTFFCIRTVFDDLLLPLCKDHGIPAQYMVCFNTVVLFSTCVAVAVFAPTIGSIISVAAGAAALMILVFPGLCLIQMCLQNSQEKLQVLAGVTMVVGGTFIATFITVQSIMTFVNESHTKDFVCEET